MGNVIKSVKSTGSDYWAAYIGGEKIKTDRVKQHTRTRPILVKKYYLANLLVPFMVKNLNSTFQVVECFLNIKTQVNLIGKKFIIIKNTRKSDQLIWWIKLFGKDMDGSLKRLPMVWLQSWKQKMQAEICQTYRVF